MNLKTFLAAVRRHWRAFTLATVLVLTLGLSAILLSPKQFVSTTQLMVSIDGASTAAAYQNDEVVAGRINTYIPLLTSEVVVQRVINKLRLHSTPPELAAQISATNVPPRTALIDVAVTDRSRQQAQLIATTLAAEFISYTEALETPTGEDSQKVHTTVVTAASVARQDVLEPVLLALLAAAAALLAGAITVWLRTRNDSVVRTSGQAEEAAGVPVLGRVGRTMASIDEIDAYCRLLGRLPAIRNRDTALGPCNRVVVACVPVGEIDTTSIASNLRHAMELAGNDAIVVKIPAPGTQVSANKTLATEASGNEGIEPEGEGAPGPPANVEPDNQDPTEVVTVAGDLVSGLTPGHPRHVIMATAGGPLTIAASTLSQYTIEVLLVLSIGKTMRSDVVRTSEALRAAATPPSGAVLIGKDEGSRGSPGFRWFRNRRMFSGGVNAASNLLTAVRSGVQSWSKSATAAQVTTKGR